MDWVRRERVDPCNQKRPISLTVVILLVLLVQEVVELSRSQHASLAADVVNAKYIEHIHQVLFCRFFSFVLDYPHLLKELIEMADEASASRALDVGEHVIFLIALKNETGLAAKRGGCIYVCTGLFLGKELQRPVVR